jgi:hypothetical protein
MICKSGLTFRADREPAEVAHALVHSDLMPELVDVKILSLVLVGDEDGSRRETLNH